MFYCKAYGETPREIQVMYTSVLGSKHKQATEWVRSTDSDIQEYPAHDCNKNLIVTLKL